MTTYTVRSRSNGKQVTFANVGSHGYVYCDMGDPRKHGTLGRQICKGGCFAGSTLTASDDDLPRVVRNWLKAYYRDVPAGWRW